MKDIIIHPNYDQTVVENDLALLVLDVESVHPYVKINANAFVPSNGEDLVVMGEILSAMMIVVIHHYHNVSSYNIILHASQDGGISIQAITTKRPATN